MESKIAKSLLLSKSLLQNNVARMASKSFRHSGGATRRMTSKTQHAWHRLRPSLKEFVTDQQNASTVAMLPDALKQKMLSDPSPGESLYQETLAESTSWVNDCIKNEMKKPTGEAAYTTNLLESYDAMVWRHNSVYHWRMNQEEAQGIYDDCLLESKSHCEIAVGTGLFLDGLDFSKCAQLSGVTLVDLQPDALQACQSRLQENPHFVNIQIDQVHANILEDPPSNLQTSFDSVAANFLVHCLPPGKETISTTFSHCASLLRDGGIFFGSTILGKELLEDAENAGPASVDTINTYNEIGVFGNRDHSFRDLSEALHESFQDVEVWRVGYCAAWKARIPK